MFTGITEPIEFSFLFVAPMLFYVQVILAGAAYMIAHILNIAVGLTFSGGLLDLFIFGILQGQDKTSWMYIIPVGIIYFFLYYFIFTFLIKRFNLKTPGREDDDTATKLYTKADVKARDAAAKESSADKASGDAVSQTITQALGGSQNITSVDACATRLRCTVADSARVNDAALKATGAVGVIKRGTGVQVVYGPQVAVIKSNLENYLATNPQDGPIEAAPEVAPVEEPKKETAPEKSDAEKRYFNSPFTGALHPITEAPDEAFAGKMTGDGFFVYPEDGVVYAPEDSTVTFVFDTKHALGMTTADGVEYLLHIGIDTVNLNGQGFKVFVENGQEVKKGDKLMEFDDEYIKANAPSDACLCIFTDTDQVPEVHLAASGKVKAGDQAVYF